MFMLKALYGDGGTVSSPVFTSKPSGVSEPKCIPVRGSGLSGIVSKGGLGLGDLHGNCVADQILSSFVPTVANRTESA
jgi:hypothetical protein